MPYNTHARTKGKKVLGWLARQYCLWLWAGLKNTASGFGVWGALDNTAFEHVIEVRLPKILPLAPDRGSRTLPLVSARVYSTAFGPGPDPKTLPFHTRDLGNPDQKILPMGVSSGDLLNNTAFDSRHQIQDTAFGSGQGLKNTAFGPGPDPITLPLYTLNNT
jgi:hypothetical protein